MLLVLGRRNADDARRLQVCAQESDDIEIYTNEKRRTKSQKIIIYLILALRVDHTFRCEILFWFFVLFCVRTAFRFCVFFNGVALSTHRDCGHLCAAVKYEFFPSLNGVAY